VNIRSHLLYAAILTGLVSITPLLLADQWTTPTKEELSMTSQDGYPGIAAVYLDRDEITEDKLHVWSVYVRLKVLTEKGKDYANVELDYGSSSNGGGYTVNDISGRTIHPDGTIIPFTGKPYEKLIERTHGAEGYKHMAKVFTMPDVEVGSIIEYRYTLRYDDYWYISPTWYIQSDLYLRKGRYVWKPTNKQLISKTAGREHLTNSIGWLPILPPGAEVKQSRLPPVQSEVDGQLILELNVHDIPPAPQEEYMPPIGSFTYRVRFYYSPYRTSEEFWKSEGKYWAKDRDKFIGPGPKVAAAVHELSTPADSQDQKLQKFYAAVMALENTDYSREHDRTEDRAAGLREVHNTDDILERKRGTSDQLTELFVAMARAAGMKAYLFALTRRDRSIFTNYYLNLSQLDDDIAVVNVDGKERFFDPGSRYCPYGHLDWIHTYAGGIRQTEDGSVIATTPGEGYSFSRTQRIADLKMDDHGEVNGTVKITYMGEDALSWRHRLLRGDNQSLQKELRTNLEHLFPGGMNVQVTSISQPEDYEKPLTVEYSVKGAIGVPTGKRLFVAADIFVSNSKAVFPHEKRQLAVYFPYPHMLQDAVRIHLPSSIKAESVPAADKQMFETSALYMLTSEQKPDSVTIRRDLSLGDFLFPPKDYPNLRSFYTKLETKDQENIVLTNAQPIDRAKSISPSN
jgi:transglutaminase-like putative cysteine protease